MINIIAMKTLSQQYRLSLLQRLCLGAAVNGWCLFFLRVCLCECVFVGMCGESPRKKNN